MRNLSTVKSLVAAAAVLAAMAACTKDVGGVGHQGAQTGAQQAQMHEHRNGLRLLLPDAVYRVTATADGFRVELASNADLRYPVIVDIRLLTTSHGIETSGTRVISSGRRLRYSMTYDHDAVVGSGGTEYTLLAMEPVRDRWIEYEQTKQSELSTPDFELWDIARGLSYMPAN